MAEGDFDIAERWRVVEVVQVQAGTGADQDKVRDVKRCEAYEEQAAVGADPLLSTPSTGTARSHSTESGLARSQVRHGVRQRRS